MTLPFSLAIKDYNTFTPLQNKTIQITNIDSKQIYTQTTDSRGYVSFNIKESERGDFFSVRLLNDNEYEPTPYYLTKQSPQPNTFTTTISKHTIQKILNPNSYANHFAILYFKAQISLYFNGTTLCIMQGTKNLASFNARSGKAITQEEKLELEQQGYEGFVSAIHNTTNNETISHSDTISYFCLDKKWQEQKDKGAIPEGEYYINPNEIDKRAIHIQESTFTQENTLDINPRIYTNKECTNTRESNTNRDNFYLYNFYHQSQHKCSNNNGIDIVNNKSDFFNILTYKAESQAVIKLQVTYPKKLESKIDFIYMSDDGLQRDKEYLHTNTIFAPGTYIELEAKLSDNVESSNTTQTLQWAFTLLYNQKEVDSLFTHNTLHTYTFYHLLDSNQIEQQEHNVNLFTNDTNTGIDTTKIGFSLPLIREYEDSSQCFIIVFAFEHTKTKPDITDPYKIIDMSFKVGEDSTNGVIESKREKQSFEQKAIYNQTSISNLKAWNELQCICSLKEAVEFLQANKEQLNKLYQNNKTLYNQKDSNGNPIYDVWFDYFRIHPSLTGKIAYIYYRFDVGSEGFIDRVKQTCYAIFNCKDEYVGERKEFVETIAQVYTGISLCNSLIDMPKLCDIINPNTKNYKQEFEDRFLHNKGIQAQQLIQDFINDMGKALKIEQEFIPQVNTKPKNGDAGTYRRYGNSLSVAQPNSNSKDEFIRFMDTIIHEFRHFYLWYVFEDARNHTLKQSYLAQLVYGNAYMYISWEYETLFNVYDKECASFDAEVLQCEREKTYSKYDENGKQKAPYPLYYIQPSERDCRVVAGAFRKKIGL